MPALNSARRISIVRLGNGGKRGRADPEGREPPSKAAADNSGHETTPCSGVVATSSDTGGAATKCESLSEKRASKMETTTDEAGGSEGHEATRGDGAEPRQQASNCKNK